MYTWLGSPYYCLVLSCLKLSQGATSNLISTPRYAAYCISQRQAPCGDLRSDPARQPQLQWPWLSRASSNPALLLTWEFCGANYTDSPPAAEFAMRLMKEPRGGLFSWCSYFSNYPLFLVLRVAVKRLQSKITQNTKKQTSSRKSRRGVKKGGIFLKPRTGNGFRTEGPAGCWGHTRPSRPWPRAWVSLFRRDSAS